MVGFLFQIFLVNGLLSLCFAVNPLDFFDPKLLESGLKILLKNKLSQSPSLFENGESSPKKNVNILYGKPIADKSSVIDSLFELNVEEIIDNIPNRSYPNHNRDSQPSFDEESQNDINDNSVLDIFQDIDFLPLVNENQIQNESKVIFDKETLNYLDSIRGDVWKHFKTILLSYIDTLDSDASHQFKMKNSFPVKMLLNLLDLGDKANIIHLLGKKIDPKVASFLIKKFKESAPDIISLKTISENDISQIIPSLNKMINKFSWLSLRNIIDKLVIRVNNTYTKGELDDYIKSLEETNAVAAKGLKFVLNLPSNFPVYDDKGVGRSLSEGRNYRGVKPLRETDYYDGYDFPASENRDIGYGDFGSHTKGSYGGYHQMGGTIDPYLILAGIGTAALLAFVAFRILNTTTSGDNGGESGNEASPEAPPPPPPPPNSPSIDSIDLLSTLLRNKRSINKFTENSQRIISAIEDGYFRFENFVEETEDVIETMNTLWKFNNTDKCSRCTMSKLLLKKRPNPNYMKTIILSAFGNLMGIPKSGQLFDKIQDFRGKSASCSC